MRDWHRRTMKHFSFGNLRLGVLLLIGVFAPAGPARADQAIKDSGQAAAKCVSVSGILLEKQAASPWKPVTTGTELRSGTTLVGLPRAELVSASGGVLVRLLADIGQRGPLPVLEAGLKLHDPVGADLDITCERGLIVLENHKQSGEAKVRLHVRGDTWTLLLQTAGTKVGLEIFGRHPPGLPAVLDAKTDVPTTDVVLLVVKGQAFLDTGSEGLGLHAPPGVASAHWDSVVRRFTFERLDKLPENLIRPLNDRESKIFEATAADAAKLAHGDLTSGLQDLLQSKSRAARFVGLTLAGAVDDLHLVAGALMTSNDAATRDQAILVLRNWLGREPGQAQKLYARLVANKKLTPVQARDVLHLLFGFNAEERGNPDTYSVLLMYLAHKNQAIRALAYWHLVRLAPAGKDIRFDAAAPEAQRREALQRWHTLIPEGRLPPRPKT